MAEIAFSKQHTAFIKGIAILLMIWHHALIPGLYICPDSILHNWWVIHLSIGGKFCVGIFTFIIGYGYACSHDRTISYLVQHIRRLLTRFWCLSLLVFIPVGVVFGEGNIADIQTITDNLLGLQFQYNCASWFVFFYVYAMLAILPISYFADRKPYLTLLLTTIVFGIAASSFMPGRINMWLNAVHRCCFYTPVLVVGYVAAKKQWVKYIPQLSADAYLLVAILALAARCMLSAVKGFTTDTIFAPIFILAAVAYLNRAQISECIKKCLERLGSVSMYMWFIHAVFYSDRTKSVFQNSPLWINNPFVSFVIVAAISYLFAELIMAFDRMIQLKGK